MFKYNFRLGGSTTIIHYPENPSSSTPDRGVTPFILNQGLSENIKVNLFQW